MKHELQRIISGNGSVRNGEIIQTITDHLRREKKTVSAIKKAKFDKEQETQILVVSSRPQVFGINKLMNRGILEKELSKKFSNIPILSLS